MNETPQGNSTTESMPEEQAAGMVPYSAAPSPLGKAVDYCGQAMGNERMVEHAKQLFVRPFYFLVIVGGITLVAIALIVGVALDKIDIDLRPVATKEFSGWWGVGGGSIGTITLALAARRIKRRFAARRARRIEAATDRESHEGGVERRDLPSPVSAQAMPVAHASTDDSIRVVPRSRDHTDS